MFAGINNISYYLVSSKDRINCLLVRDQMGGLKVDFKKQLHLKKEFISIWRGRSSEFNGLCSVTFNSDIMDDWSELKLKCLIFLSALWILFEWENWTNSGSQMKRPTIEQLQSQWSTYIKPFCSSIVVMHAKEKLVWIDNNGVLDIMATRSWVKFIIVLEVRKIRFGMYIVRLHFNLWMPVVWARGSQNGKGCN